VMLPAVGQGAIGIEARQNDDRILQLLAPLDDQNTRYCVMAERAMNNHLQGGCQVPIACHSKLEQDTITLKGLVGSLDGKHIITANVAGNKQQATELGIMLAEQLIAQGADKILSQM